MSREQELDAEIDRVQHEKWAWEETLAQLHARRGYCDEDICAACEGVKERAEFFLQQSVANCVGFYSRAELQQAQQLKTHRLTNVSDET